MEIFKKNRNSDQTRKCPNCGAEMVVDSVQDIGECPYCGTKCNLRQDNGVVGNVISFIERQQQRIDKKNEEKRQKELEEERKRQEHLKRFWWVYVLGFGLLVAAAIVFAVLGI